MKSKLIGLCICMLLILIVVPIVKPFHPPPTKSLMKFVDAITFSQIDFYFDNESFKNSDWGRIQVDIEQLTRQYGEGFLNIYTDAGWVVRNEFINPNGIVNYLSMDFDLGVEPGTNVQSLSAYIEFTPEPFIIFQDGNRSEYEVRDTDFSAAGVGDYFGFPVHMYDPVPFEPQGKTYDFTKPIESFNENVQCAHMQCFPMAIANSLQYLEDRHPTRFVIPHDHVIGLKGDDSLVGQLDTYVDRDVDNRSHGHGVWFEPMMEAKFEYLADNGLGNKLIHKHQGYGYGKPIKPGDFTYAGITSKDESVNEKVTFAWLEDQLRACEDVEVVKDGHAVRVYGCGRVKGKPYIRYLDDSNQTCTDPTDTNGLRFAQLYVSDIDSDGMMNWGSSGDEIWWAMAESVKMMWWEFEPIFFGWDIRIKILNDGDPPIYNLSYKIELEGWVFKGKITEGVIDLKPHSEEEIVVNVFGIGPVSIIASTEEDTANGQCFLFGPFVLFLTGAGEE